MRLWIIHLLVCSFSETMVYSRWVSNKTEMTDWNQHNAQRNKLSLYIDLMSSAHVFDHNGKKRHFWLAERSKELKTGWASLVSEVPLHTNIWLLNKWFKKTFILTINSYPCLFSIESQFSCCLLLWAINMQCSAKVWTCLIISKERFLLSFVNDAQLEKHDVMQFCAPIAAEQHLNQNKKTAVGVVCLFCHHCQSN